MHALRGLHHQEGELTPHTARLVVMSHSEYKLETLQGLSFQLLRQLVFQGDVPILLVLNYYLKAQHKPPLPIPRPSIGLGLLHFSSCPPPSQGSIHSLCLESTSTSTASTIASIWDLLMIAWN